MQESNAKKVCKSLVERPILIWSGKLVPPLNGSCGLEVEYPDIYHFLIATPNLFTGDSLKAYKSLDVYNYYISGWVNNIHVIDLPRCLGTLLITVRVKHSQKLSATSIKPWVAVMQQGMIVCEHCTCMASPLLQPGDVSLLLKPVSKRKVNIT